MSRFTASQVGALDSDAIRSGRAIGAHLLRHLAGQANLQRGLGSIMSNVALNGTDVDETNGDAATVTRSTYAIQTDSRWRLVMPWLAPRRPLWTVATLVITARAISGTIVRFGITFRNQGLERIQVLQFAGSGSADTFSAIVQLPEGGELERCRLWVQGSAGLAVAISSDVGTPVSWTGSTIVDWNRLEYTGVETWNFPELYSGRYAIRASDSAGEIFQRPITYAFARSSEAVIEWQRGNVITSPLALDASQRDRANASGTTFTISQSNRKIDLYAVSLVGGAT